MTMKCTYSNKNIKLHFYDPKTKITINIDLNFKTRKKTTEPTLQYKYMVRSILIWLLLLKTPD